MFCRFYPIYNMENPVSKQQTHFVASDQGLHYLPMTLLRVSSQEWMGEMAPSEKGTTYNESDTELPFP